MNREDVTELHYITAIANLPSILRHGILSHTPAVPEESEIGRSPIYPA